MEFLASCLALGLAVGFVAGLLGVGGGLLIVPVLAWLLEAQGFTLDAMHYALGTSLASILFTSISSLRAHHARGAVDWTTVRRISPGILTGAFVGAALAARLSPLPLKIFFVGFLSTSRCRCGGISNPLRTASCQALPACSARGV